MEGFGSANFSTLLGSRNIVFLIVIIKLETVVTVVIFLSCVCNRIVSILLTMENAIFFSPHVFLKKNELWLWPIKGFSNVHRNFCAHFFLAQSFLSQRT